MKMIVVTVQAAVLLMLAVIGAQGSDTKRAICPVSEPGAYCER